MIQKNILPLFVIFFLYSCMSTAVPVVVEYQGENRQILSGSADIPAEAVSEVPEEASDAGEALEQTVLETAEAEPDYFICTAIPLFPAADTGAFALAFVPYLIDYEKVLIAERVAALEAEKLKKAEEDKKKEQKSTAAAKPVQPAVKPVQEKKQPPAAAKIETGKTSAAENIVQQEELYFDALRSIKIVIPGKGWIIEKLPGKIVFVSRTVENDSTVFVFNAENAGAYPLFFQLQDLENGTAVRRHYVVNAAMQKPVAALTMPVSEAAQETLKDEKAAEFSSPVDKTRASELLDYITLNRGVRDVSEELFFLAQLYEKDRDARNARLAVKYYTMLTDDYPESEYSGKARSRILFLKRHFLEIK
jgi:hypothetical protein